MPQVLKDLFRSEKAVVAFTILLAITVFVALGKMTVDEWRVDALWILGIYTGGKTAQGVADAVARRNAPATPQFDIPGILSELAKIGSKPPTAPPDPPPVG